MLFLLLLLIDMFYLKIGRERTETDLAYNRLLLRCLQQLKLGLTETSNPKLATDLPSGRQRSKRLSHPGCLQHALQQEAEVVRRAKIQTQDVGMASSILNCVKYWPPIVNMLSTEL